MSALVVPMVRVRSCARGLPCVFVYCTCTTELYHVLYVATVVHVFTHTSTVSTVLSTSRLHFETCPEGPELEG